MRFPIIDRETINHKPVRKWWQRGRRMLGKAPVAPVIPVADTYRARKFYEQILNLRLSQATPLEIVYHCGEGTKLALNIHPEARADAITASFIVDDIDAAVKELMKKGILFVEYRGRDITKVNGINRTGPLKTARFKDSEGNILALVEVSN
jgi:catechol 2,3-dioxygenase-like lactoylglutathione lyase family enzyme